MHLFPFYLISLLLILFLSSNSCAISAQPIDDKKNAPTITFSTSERIKKWLDKHFTLPQSPLADKTAQSVFIRRAKREIKELLATKGYFTPTIQASHRLQKNELVIEIEPGPRTLVSEVDIRFLGDLANDNAKQRARIKKLQKKWPLKAGSAFRSEKWEKAKTELLSEVTYEDYPAAYIADSQAVVDPENATAKLLLVIDSGPVFYFGPLVISGLQRYSEDELQINNRPYFRQGEPYRRDALLAFQAALQNTPHFSSVSVSINPDISSHEAAPVEVIISEKKAKNFAVGGGFSSNNGARGEISYRDYNFLGRAWDMNTTLRMEQKRQTFFVGIDTMPNYDNARYSFDARLQRTDIKDLETINQRASISRQHLTKSTLQQYGISWQREEKRPSGGINQTNEALALNWRWRHHLIDDPVNIRDGRVTELYLSGGSEQILSDQDFVYTHAQQQFWWPIGKRDVLYLRGEAGYTLAESRSGIPQEFLFRAGGIQSVRGYDFLSLGVREGNAIVGGRTMATGTLEYTHWFLQNWGGALFTDVGDAADSWKNFDLGLGYGAGIRWRTPAGPLALDLARRHDTGTLRFHFSIIVAF